MTIAHLQGFFAPGFVPEGRQRFAVGAMAAGMDPARRTVEVADARLLQLPEDGSEAEFFGRHGFVLLPHVSGVADWDTDIASIYVPEIDQVIRERLLPGRRVQIMQQPSLLRRGRGTPAPVYADGVHSDGGLDADDYAHNIGAFATEEAERWWRTVYDRGDVAGLIWIDFWRPTNMTGPLEHMPLGLCDPTSLEVDDIVRTAMTGIAPAGRETRHLSLRFNAGQRWFYYPRMTCGELLAFKLAEFWKEPASPRNCFHSAFRDPDAPACAEERQSCEHRVSVLILNE